MSADISIAFLAEHSDLLQPGGVTSSEFQFANMTNSSEELFERLSNVTSINVAYQELTEFQTLVGRCKNVEFLSLAYNNITSVSRIATFRELIKIDLSSNKITSLGFRSFWEQLKSLKFLYLHSNNIQTLQVLEVTKDLQSLSVLTLYLNPIAEIADYYLWIINMFPYLDVLDNIRIAATERFGNIDKYAKLSSYEHHFCSFVSVFKEEYSSEVVQKVVTMFNERLDNNEMWDKNLKDYHDLFCFREFNIFVACIEAESIVEFTLNCPITLIQKACRVFLSCKRIKRYKEHEFDATIMIEKYMRGYTVYKRLSSVINTNISKKLNAAAVILRVLLARQALHKVENMRLNELKEKYQLARIIKALRERKLIRYETDFNLIETEIANMPEVLHLFVAKTFDTEQGLQETIKDICDFIKEEIQQNLSGNELSDLENYKNISIEFNATRFRVLSESHLIQCKQIYVNSTNECLRKQLRQDYSIEHFVEHRCFVKALSMTTQYLTNARFFNVRKMLASQQQQKSSEDLQHECSWGTGTPYYFHVRIIEKDIVAFFKYAMEEIQGVQWPKTKQYQDILSFGGLIYNRLIAAGTKHEFIELFMEHIIPLSLPEKEEINSQLVISMPGVIQHMSAALTIQKIFRAHMNNEIVRLEFASLLRMNTLRIEEIILISRAAEIIERNFRGVGDRTKVLILTKMRNAFSSALEGNSFLIHEDTLEELESNPISSRWFRQQHMNYSSPVSEVFAHKIFAQADLEAMNINLTNSTCFREFAFQPRVLSNMYSSFNGQLFASANMQNEGYIQLYSRFLGNSPLNSKALLSWVRHLPEVEESEFEYFGALVCSSEKEEVKAYDFIDLEAIKAMCGLRKSAESSIELDRLLDLFALRVQDAELDYRKSVENIFKNVEICDFTENMLPRYLRDVGKRFITGLKIVKLPISQHIWSSDIAFKALLLELMFCDPGDFSTSSKSFIARKWIFTSQPGITISQSTLIALISTIEIQKHIRSFIAFKKYSLMPKKTTLLKKINALFKEENQAQEREVEEAEREMAAINLIKCAQKINEVNDEEDETLYINEDVDIRPAKLYVSGKNVETEREKNLSAAEVRYESCLCLAAKDSQIRKMQNENRLKIQTIHELTKETSAYERDKEIRPSTLLLELEKTLNKEIMQPALTDQIRTRRLENQPILMPLKCESYMAKEFSASRGSLGGTHASSRAAESVIKNHITKQQVDNRDLRYFSAEMQRKAVNDEIRLTTEEEDGQRKEDRINFENKMEELEDIKQEKISEQEKRSVKQVEKRRQEVVKSREKIRSRSNISAKLRFCTELESDK